MWKINYLANTGNVHDNNNNGTPIYPIKTYLNNLYNGCEYELYINIYNSLCSFEIGSVLFIKSKMCNRNSKQPLLLLSIQRFLFELVCI